MDRQFNNTWLGYIGVAVIAIFFTQIYFLTQFVPNKFPVGGTFTINENESLRTISRRLKEEKIISSALLFRVWVSFKNSDRHVQLGVYDLKEPLVLGAMVKRLVETGPDHPLIKLTVPEGSTIREVVKASVLALPTLSEKKLLEIIKQKGVDGKLFPSTYFLLPSVNEERVITMMVALFDDVYGRHFASLPKPKTLPTDTDIISLAAILEGEAKTFDDMKTISGILQKRLAINMPLQVDVAMETYKTRGVPKIPINNPGENALRAVFYPTESPFLYYITGKDGTMYYAKTFEEHKRNITNYLR